MKSHFVVGVLLYICCRFSEQLFPGTILGGCFCIYIIATNCQGNTCHFVMAVYRGQYRAIFEFWWKIQSKLFRSHRGLLQVSKIYKEYFHVKKWLHRHVCFCPFDTASTASNILFLRQLTLKWPIMASLGFCGMWDWIDVNTLLHSFWEKLFLCF